MDVELIDLEEGNMGLCGGITDDGDDDSNDGGEMNAYGHSLAQDEERIVHEPHVGMEFDSEDSAKMFYEDYARGLGFGIRIGHFNRSKPAGKATSREFLCSGDGLKKRPGERCRAMLKIELRGENKWIVTKLGKEHTHPVLSHGEVHYLNPRRHFTAKMNSVVESHQGVNIVPTGVMYASMDGNHVPPEMNHVGKSMSLPESNHTFKNTGSLSYMTRHPRRRTLARDAQDLLDYFKKMQAENPGFYYAIQLDEENRMANAFWADARSRAAYSHFGDAVIMDTIYRRNEYTVPFAPFTGVNHHGQKIMFGCALLLDESEATYVWLFQTFLTAMNDRPPVSLTTDKDRAIQVAVSKVFPEARHCINKWHMLREGQERMAQVCLAHPNFQVDLYNCINMTQTVEEFESFWASLLEKYDLKRNDWLQSIYDARRQWVPAYFRDSFFAIFPCLGFESSFFDGYVNQQTTLPLFFREYERALENSFEREIEADSDTICTTPVLRTPSPMEKQTANLYTKRMFSKFQEELVETFVYTANRIDGDVASSIYRVAKFEDDNKAYIVSVNNAEMKANCSCQMFEYSGILCRHVLTVFTVTNVLTLPWHYILKRWTINAKSVIASEEHSEPQSHESLITRYNNLCKEAMKLAEEGAIASETYSVVLASLREGGKKVSDIKRSIAKVPPSSSQVSGVGYDDIRTSTATPEMTPLLWPRQDEILRRFNLNDASVTSHPISDLNAPTMAPVSVNHDDGHSDRTVVLPCLKSMTWVMENKNSTTASRLAVINLKLQDYSRTHVGESEVKFSLSRLTLEPMLRSMAYISEQLSTPANKVAVINLKLQDSETTSGESEVKFQVSRDTLGAMLRSMAYIREQLSNAINTKQDNTAKRQRK
ncbi:protein FAR1-RELATED SEQUENCE 3 [Sesamum indicum]|uniref:Protein FAR1-RELATED SEQUENCE n=1 Tax=Sesamum indicum TaxID=4182 RepID=A0A6I9TAF8_SESIN|nr:protein FAR1-RELATED SEQUENCE 3 [Sesamum indicum]XP_020550366.1 protein FAR1-RELATED SEQUENCE 3 [Sesamum indicum]